MAVELGRTWCVRHGHLRFARLFWAAAAEQQRLIGVLVRGCGRHHEPQYGAVVCVEETAPAGGWIRRRRRRATGRRRAGKRRIELSPNENLCFADQHRKLRGAFRFLGRGRRGTGGA